ncbi:MAG TPA: diacylglycerol kinase family protein [Ktedonobacteraceae bacterium]|jgi:YegS/Rv2252/BmrU family lipid kinase|nr:diacylglycerol kinase family protein [Ktedonobacteraceae bacterium]
MRTVLIFNPTSGISTVTDKRMSPEETEKTILQGLQTYGIEPEVYYTTPEDTGQGLASRAAAERAELVIAVGGDGTIHAVANGLVGTQSTLAIIPTGTMNNLAHSLNIPDTIPAACVAIAKGETRLIDVGKINEHMFLEVAGIGLEASLFPAAEEIKKPGLLTTLQGVVYGLITLLKFKPTRIRITFDERQRHPYEALQVTICNAPFYGMHLEVVPNILMDDGLLDVVIYRNFSKLEYIRHAISISQGRRLYQPKIIHRRVRSLRINSDQSLDLQVDGVPQGTTPALVTVVPGALRVCVPGIPAPGLHTNETDNIDLNTPVNASNVEP